LADIHLIINNLLQGEASVADIQLVLTIILLLIVLSILIMVLKKASKDDILELVARLDGFEKVQEKTERAIREEIGMSRNEFNIIAREQRKELAEAFKTFSESVAERMMDVAEMQKGQLDIFSGQLGSFAKDSGEKLDSIRVESATGSKELRGEVVTTLQSISETMAKTMKDLAVAEKIQLEAMSSAIVKLSDSNERKLESVRVTVESKLKNIQTDNAMHFEQMRQTVDEKLQGTLEKRLGDSFRQVSERLELVHKGLGEMQALATGVGDLKKVLTNVKTRGTWGEVQLGVLLEQVLNPDQFASNVATKGGGERVEFAIVLPGANSGEDDTVWLPIDAKFPVEDYQRLIESQERADLDGVEAAGKQLENTVKACAWDICRKYLNPPKTTDFGILFLPIEGLFAEVIRRTGLVETIQRECRVVIAGPTTLWSVLNSLQMGFRTLAIQKRSSEVWKLLAAVKTEWTKYGDVLDAVQKKLHQASDTIEKAKVRSRAVGRKLRDVQTLPIGEAESLLPLDASENDELDHQNAEFPKINRA
jgi:DNA recombination protein RmuC